MILISGSLAFDSVMNYPGKFEENILPEKLRELNVSFLVNKMWRGMGGTAGNIAYTLSLLGIKCSIIGLVGEDFGPYREFLDKNGIDTQNVKKVHGYFTSMATGITDSTESQIWGFYTGADELSDNLSINHVNGVIDFGVIAPHNPKTMLKFAHQYLKKKIDYVFDPGMQLPWFFGDDLIEAFKGAKIIIGNDYEISVMEKKTGIKSLHSLSNAGKIIITTYGARGSKVSRENETVEVVAAKVKNTSDPAGAGDAYRGGFIAGYLQKLPIRTCAQIGSVAAAYTVEQYGTTTHTYSTIEFARRYKENYGEDLKL